MVQQNYRRIVTGAWLALLATSPAFAGSSPAYSTTGADWLDWQTMTGDWGGLRTQLKNDGIDLTAHYVAEVAGNPVGGLEQGGAYAHEFGIGADISSQLLGWNGGTLHAIITERAGSSLSKDKIGNILTVQEIYGDGQTVRITQLSFEQHLFDNALQIEAGRMNTENNFATSPKYFGTALWCNFQNNSICGTPIAAPINSSGYVAYPASSWGARLQLNVGQQYYIGAGAYEINPSLYGASNGFKLGIDGAQGVFTTMEVGYRTNPASLPGNYRFGGYYDNSSNPAAIGQAMRFLPRNSPILALLPSTMTSGKNGFWALADQTIEQDGPKRGTVLFAALEYGDHATALITWFGEAGVVRQGTFPGRDNDTADVGFAIANLNNQLLDFEKANGVAGTSQEFMVEANYGVAIAPWFNLRPGVQYVWHPSGENERRNALVLALKSAIAF